MTKYNLHRQEKDFRDYKITAQQAITLPDKADLRALCPPVFNQGDLGSCTANAGVAARMMMNKPTTTLLSRLFLYYKEREILGTVNQDSGASMRSICKALAKYGVCQEAYWPYIIKDYAKKPNLLANLNALKYKISTYQTFDSTNDEQELFLIRHYLAMEKQPVLAGIEVYQSFESADTAKTGIIPMPNVEKEQFLGGHAILLVGYDDKNKWFIFRNSWGTQWGDQGYGFLPYQFVVDDLAFDFWVIQ